ncbi:hypothetical protein CVT24_011388 [Panaeolus cyanescens]|uniref:RING-type domain-containing protein n=1 Tax=Panaeolus cyanescens TaxID=181874 RepID=A0A409YGL5_9AGAR|nr:hypothetical protein CVT24_011388 [Panaeolus cyanescens]
MLSLAPASSCDICAHDYDDTVVVPHTITCGHVFCRSCIMQVQGPLTCPICRKPFEMQDVRKLHISFDKGLLEKLQCKPEDLRTAERFQNAMANVVDAGIHEKGLRQLIQEMKAWLQGQPRHLFGDLRISLRIMSYMCDNRAKLRGFKQDNEKLNEEIRALTLEKEALQDKLKEEIEIRKYEKETALAVEVSLREHCENANKVYTNAIE